jgi:hypothetical protein
MLFLDVLFELLGLFPPVALVGALALIAALVNLGKQVGIVKDGTAQWWNAGLNAVFWIVIRLAVGSELISEANLDAFLAAAATIISVLAPIAIGFIGTGGLHGLGRLLGVSGFKARN